MLAVAGEHREESRRCRVLCVIAGMPAGGAERQLALLLDGLDRRAFEPGLLIFNAPARIHYPQIFDRELWFRALGLSGTSAVKLIWPLLSGIDRAVRDFAPDVVFATLNVANHAVRLSRLVFRWPAPVVTSVRVSYRDGYAAKEKLAERLLWRQSASIVCNAAATRAEMMADLGIPGERIEFVPNGIDPSFFQTAPVSPPVWWPKGRTALTIGRFSDQKHHVGLVRALAELERRRGLGDWQFVFVGEGPRESEIRAEIAALGLADRIRLHSPVADPALLYRAAELVIIPSRFEGTPNVALEAQATARPVAITAAANHSGVVTRASGFILGDDLSHALEDVLAHPRSSLEAYGNAARERMLSGWSSDAMVERMQGVFRAAAHPNLSRVAA